MKLDGYLAVIPLVQHQTPLIWNGEKLKCACTLSPQPKGAFPASGLNNKPIGFFYSRDFPQKQMPC